MTEWAASRCPSQAQFCTPRKQRLLGPKVSHYSEVLDFPQRPRSSILSLSSRNHHAQGLADDKTAEHAVINPTALPWGWWGTGSWRRRGSGGQLLLSAKPSICKTRKHAGPPAASLRIPKARSSARIHTMLKTTDSLHSRIPLGGSVSSSAPHSRRSMICPTCFFLGHIPCFHETQCECCTSGPCVGKWVTRI